MKKLLIAIMIVIMALAFVGCGDDAESEETTEAETTAATISAEPDYTDYSYVKELSSTNGYDMGVHSVAITPEGDIIMRTEGDLAASIGWQLTIASDAKDVYVEEFGNGGFFSIVIIKEDGTVSAVNTLKLREEKKLEVMDNLGGYKDIVRVEGEHTVDSSIINVFDSSGEKYMLDPYLK